MLFKREWLQRLLRPVLGSLLASTADLLALQRLRRLRQLMLCLGLDENLNFNVRSVYVKQQAQDVAVILFAILVARILGRRQQAEIPLKGPAEIIDKILTRTLQGGLIRVLLRLIYL